MRRDAVVVRSGVRTVTVGAVALLGCAVLAAPAAAQSVSVGRPCYVNANPAVGSPIQVSGAGFTPGDALEVEGQGVFGTMTADAAGGFRTIVQGPILPTTSPAAKRFMLNVHDETNGATSASTTVLVANLAFRTMPGVAKPNAEVRYRFSGFRPGHAIYGHFTHKRATLTHRFGRAKGPCGMLTARTKLFPGGHPRFRHYKVQFDDARRLHAKSTPRITTSISIQLF